MRYKRIVFYNYDIDMWESFYVNKKGQYKKDRIDFTRNNLTNDLKSAGFEIAEKITKTDSMDFYFDEVRENQRLIDRAFRNWSKISRADKFALMTNIELAEGYSLSKYQKKIKRFKTKPATDYGTVKSSTCKLNYSKKSPIPRFWINYSLFEGLHDTFELLEKPSRVEIDVTYGDNKFVSLISGSSFKTKWDFERAMERQIKQAVEADVIEQTQWYSGNIKITLKGKM